MTRWTDDPRAQRTNLAATWSSHASDPGRLALDEKSAVPSPILTAAARSFVGPLAMSPKYLDHKSKHDPFPSYRPLTGKAGIVGPGSQFWQHPAETSDCDHPPYNPNTLSEAADKFKHPNHKANYIDKDQPVTDRTHGKGTGFVSNTGSAAGVDWMGSSNDEGANRFRTTYNDIQAYGFSAPRRRP